MEDHKKLAQSATSEFAWVADLWGMFAPRWGWFLLSVLLCMSGAMLYLMSQPNIYTRSASILVKDDSKGGSANTSMSEFSDMGIFKNNTNINNELLTLKSPTLMTEVVTRLGLNETYTVRDGLKRVQLYRTAPCMFTFTQPVDQLVSFKVNFTSKEGCQLTDFQVDDQSVDQTCTVQWGDSVVTPAGTLIATATPHFAASWLGKDLQYTKGRIQPYADAYCAALRAELGSKEATIITLSIDDASIRKAEDILFTLIEVYNEKWVLDKNQIAISTSKFIGERLGIIESELGHVDENISSFKSEHLMPDVQAASNLYMQQSAEYKKQLQTLTNQLSTAQYIRRELNGKQLSQPLPANSGISSANIESQIGAYNKLVLDRNRLLANSSEKNPLVVDLTASLNSLKRTILQSVDNLIMVLNTEMRSIRSQEAAATTQLASNPNQAKYLLSVERQQKVKEELYLYLLQKREENELSQAFTAYNTRVITAPRGSNEPTSPQRGKILLMAFVVSLALPAAVIYLIENMNTRVRGRKDLELLTVPLVGEIPFVCDSVGKHCLSKDEKKDEKSHIVVEEGNRNIINEAFRVMRSNLDFMQVEGQQLKVFIVTSFNPGSGKSFLSANVAMSFALKGKKVLMIDGDMRHASLSAVAGSPKVGLSDYLSGRHPQWRNLVVTHPDYPELAMIGVGVIPPNPTELLENGKLVKLIDELRQEYDYIFIDCPPIDIVADTQIISQLADRTLFVVRAGLLDRSMLPLLQGLYDQKRFKGMAVVLNGTQSTRGRYSYRYAYHYGYGNYYSTN